MAASVSILRTLLQAIKEAEKKDQVLPEIFHLGGVIPPDGYTLFLTDIDDVLILRDPATPNGRVIAYNLIEDMKLLQRDQGVVTAAFSNMGLTDFITKTGKGWKLEDENKLRRTNLFAYAKENGFVLETAITNSDLGYGHGPGAVFSELYMAVATEYEAVKDLPDDDPIKIDFINAAGALEDKLADYRERVVAERIQTSPYAKLLVKPKQPGSYFEDDRDYRHGIQKIGALLCFLESSIKKPKKIIFIDDNPGCLQAIRAMIDIYNQDHPLDTIELDTILFTNEGFASKNMVGRHFAGGPLAYPITTVQDVADLVTLKKSLESRWMKVPFFSTPSAGSLQRLMSLCSKGNPEALFLLAQALVDNSLGIVDAGAAYKFARLARIFSKDKKFKAAADEFIRVNNLSELEGGQIANDDIQKLLNMLTSTLLNKGGALWKQLKIWQQKRLEEIWVQQKRADPNAELSRIIPYQDVYSKVSRAWGNGAKLHTYHIIMHRYLTCTEPAEAYVIEQYIENHFLFLLADDAILEPEAHFSPGKNLSKKLMSEVQKLELADDIGIVNEKKEELEVIAQNFSREMRPVHKDVYEQNKKEQSKQSPFNQPDNSLEAQALKNELSNHVTIKVGSKKQINPVLIDFCERGDATALYLLAQAALKGDGLVQDYISAHYLAELAYMLATPKGQGDIKKFIDKNFGESFVNNVLPYEGCQPVFPLINGYTPSRLFDAYKYYCELDDQMGYVAQQEHRQASLGDDSRADDKDEKGKGKEENVLLSNSPNASMFGGPVPPLIVQSQKPVVDSSYTPSTP